MNPFSFNAGDDEVKITACNCNLTLACAVCNKDLKTMTHHYVRLGHCVCAICQIIEDDLFAQAIVDRAAAYLTLVPHLNDPIYGLAPRKSKESIHKAKHERQVSMSTAGPEVVRHIEFTAAD